MNEWSEEYIEGYKEGFTRGLAEGEKHENERVVRFIKALHDRYDDPYLRALLLALATEIQEPAVESDIH